MIRSLKSLLKLTKVKSGSLSIKYDNMDIVFLLAKDSRNWTGFSLDLCVANEDIGFNFVKKKCWINDTVDTVDI